MPLPSQTTGTGEMSTTPTSYHGTRTNTSQSTVDHAGLKEPPPLLLIDSTSFSETTTQPQLDSMLKLLSTAKPVETVKVETQVVSTALLTNKVSQTHHANNTLLLTNHHATQFTNAKTAPGHHAQKVKLAKINAGLLTTNTTMPPTTTASPELTR